MTTTSQQQSLNKNSFAVGSAATLEVQEDLLSHNLFLSGRAYAALAYMSNMKYSLDKQHISCMVNTCSKGSSMIQIRIDRLLKPHGRTFYWLAKETGISHTTLWRLKKAKALGINFITLEKLCKTLNCQPGDLFTSINQKDQRTKKKT